MPMFVLRRLLALFAAPAHLQGFSGRTAEKVGPRVVQNLQEFCGVPSREQAA
jgi:hypothetical protein